MNLDDELRSALARRDPPAGFAERVVARATRRTPRLTAYRAAGWAVAAMLLVGSGFEYYRYREALQAKQEALVALRIAGKQMAMAQKKLARLSIARPLPEKVNQ